MTNIEQFKRTARETFGTVSGEPTGGFRIAVSGKRMFRQVVALAEQYNGTVAPNTNRYPQLMRIAFTVTAC